MDLDKPLDDLIPSKRNERSARTGGDRGGRAERPRMSGGRRDSAPYARPPPRSADDKWVHDAYPGAGRRDRGERGERVAGRPGPAAFVGSSPCVEVSGLHYEVTAADLKTIFSQAGTIVEGPTIRYDRSGRSTGAATIEFSTPQQAKAAINKFDGAMTKGETIAIRLIAPKRTSAAAADKDGSSLLSRLGGGSKGGDLSSRMGKEPQGDRERGSRGDRGRERSDRGTRGGARGSARGRAAPRDAPRTKRGPATAEDLDKELDGFMKPDAAGDVAMA